MLAVGFLIVIDFFTGIYAAIKQKEIITSKKMGKSINKLIFYNVAIITGVILQYVTGAGIPVVKAIGMFLAVRESYSILENVNIITGANIVPYLKKLINRNKDTFLDGLGKDDTDSSKSE